MANDNNIVELTNGEKVTCVECNSNNIITRKVKETFIYGENENSVELSVVIPIRKCRDCNIEFEDDEAEELRHNEVCMYLKRLNPQDIKNIRDIYRLTRKQFADITLIGEASLARWETGGLIQSAALDKYLRLLENKDIFKLLSEGKNDHLISNTINEDRDKSYPIVLGTVSPALSNRSTSVCDIPKEVQTKAHQMYIAVTTYGLFSCES